MEYIAPNCCQIVGPGIAAKGNRINTADNDVIELFSDVTRGWFNWFDENASL